jgi:cell division protein FtsQ
LAISISHPADLPRGWTRRARALVLAAFVALVAGGFMSSRTSLLHARAVEVTGDDRRSRLEIVTAAGISRATNVLWFGEAEAERRLLADPWIEHANVSVDLPWTIRVEVRERVPVAIANDGVLRVLIAADGTALGPASPTDRRLPVIDLPAARADDGPRPSAAGAARAVGALSSDVRDAIARITILGDATIEIRLRSGIEVRYGEAVDVVRKAAALDEVLAWAEEEGERLLRVSLAAPGMPAVRVAA